MRIVTPAKLDHQWAVGAARFFYWRLLKRGAEIYEYQPTKLHSKLIVIDDVVHIGSANFDLQQPLSQPGDDAAGRGSGLRGDDAALRRRRDRRAAGEITPEAHRASMTWWNRLHWGFGYFLVATADYNLSRRLNFTAADASAGAGRGPEPSPSSPRTGGRAGC